MNEGKCQKITLTRKSIEARFEGCFAYARVRIGREQVSLPDDVERPG
jgi:hypothetical protein